MNNMNCHLSNYEIEQNEIEKRIWSLINWKNSVVIDFGIGKDAASAKRSINAGAKVIVVDNDIEKLVRHKELDAILMRCDIRDHPFKNKIADIAVFYFTLHEIDPLLHDKIISKVAQITSKILIVEPTPGGSLAYRRYMEVWHDAMHSIGKFEDLQMSSYWEKLIQKNGFEILISKKITHRENVPAKIIENMIHSTIKNWDEENVQERYIHELRNFLDYAKEKGLKWSDLTVIIGESAFQ
jgi:hypothetical protein